MDHQITDGSEIIGAAARKSGQFKIKVYDFRRPDKFSKDQIRTVSIMHETFARLTTASLSAQLRMQAELHVSAVDQLTYGEFVSSIPDPTTLAIVTMDPLLGSAVLEIDPSLAFSMIDRLFGGRGTSGDIERSLTKIERTALEGITSRMLGHLGQSWSKVIDLKPRLGQIETRPQFAQVVPPMEMVILVTFQTSVGGVNGMINLCIPYLTIEPIIGKLSAQYWYSTVQRTGSGPNAPQTATLRVPSALYHQAESLSLRTLSTLKRGSRVGIPGLDQGEAILQVGGEAVARLELDKTRCGKHRVTETGQTEPAPLEPVEEDARASIPAVLDGPFRLMQKSLDEAISRLTDRLTHIGRRQDEMADQLLLGGTGAAEPSEFPGRPFAFVRMGDVDSLVRLIAKEHLQTVALIVSYLESGVAGAVLSRLPESVQPDIVERIATLDRTAPSVVQDVEHVVREGLAAMGTWELTAAGGVESVVELLNLAPRTVERNVVETLERKAPGLAEDIKKHMFVFEDVVLLDGASLDRIVAKADPEDTALALKTVTADIRGKILDAAPDGKAILERMDDLGRRRLSEVEAAQQRIVSLIRSMEENGEIIVARPDETID